MTSAAGHGEAGFVTIQHVWIIATSLVLLAMFANVIVAQYGRGVVRSALDEGVRAGVRVTADPAAAQATCETVATAARRDLLGGEMGDAVDIACTVATDRITATARVTFPAWFPAVPAWTFTEDAVALREPAVATVAP